MSDTPTMRDLYDDNAKRNPPRFSQLAMARWLAAMHGNDTALRDKPERACRLLEEALETAQAVGMPKEQALALVEYVYSRPASENVAQELGGTLTTLTALATACEVDLMEAVNTEFTRMWENIDRIREKQRSKPEAVVATRALPDEDESETVINVQKQYSVYLGGRFRKHGAGSAEELREKLLLPALRQHRRVRIDFGGAIACGSFTEELFGGLVRAGLPESELRERLAIVASDPELPGNAWACIHDADGWRSGTQAGPLVIHLERDHARYFEGPLSTDAARATELLEQVVLPAFREHPYRRIVLDFSNQVPSSTFNQVLFGGLAAAGIRWLHLRLEVRADDNGGTANEAALFIGLLARPAEPPA